MRPALSHVRGAPCGRLGRVAATGGNASVNERAFVASIGCTLPNGRVSARRLQSERVFQPVFLQCDGKVRDIDA